MVLHILFVVTMTTLSAVGRFGDPETVQSWSIFFALPLKSCTFACPFFERIKQNEKEDFDGFKFRTFIVVGLWKILLTFCCMLALTSQYISTSELFHGANQ